MTGKNLQRTLVLIKPDALSRKVVGKVVTRFEEEGFRLIGLKMVLLTRQRAEEFYQEHRGKDFFEPLVDFMSSNPCLVMVLEGKNAVVAVRSIAGNTDPEKAEQGTLRKLYAQDNRHNILHAADSAKSAEREIKFFFSDNEVYEWEEKVYRK